MLYKDTTGDGSDLTKSQQATKEGQQILIDARKELLADKERSGFGTDTFYNPTIIMKYRDKLSEVNPSMLDNFYKEFDTKINPVDKAKIGWPITDDNPFS